MRHIATEGRMWVVSVGVLLREADLPRDLAALGIYAPGELISPGDSVIVDPLGNIVAGPAHGTETILLSDEAPSQALLARRGFDAVGHYGRADVFSLAVKGVPITLEIGDNSPIDQIPDHIWQVTDARQVSSNAAS